MITRIIKVIISSGYFSLQILYRLIVHSVGLKSQSTCVVLSYHEIQANQRSRFARQMDYLLKWAKPITADNKKYLPQHDNYVAITFDDGFQNVVKYALPELAKRSIPATIFIPTEYLGRSPEWIRDLRNPSRYELIITENQLKNLRSDLINIGSHSVSHPNFVYLDEEQANAEFYNSKYNLELITEQPIKLFAFPYGSYNQKLVNLAKQAGYKRVFMNLPNRARLENNAFLIGRIDVSPADWYIEFILKMRGSYQWLTKAVALKRYLLNFPKSFITRITPLPKKIISFFISYHRFYMIRRPLSYTATANINGNVEMFQIDKDKVELIRNITTPKDFKRFREKIFRGEKCNGLRIKKGEIVSLCFWSPKEQNNYRDLYSLKGNEFAATEVYTVDSFRGQGYAGNLLYLRDKFLLDEGFRYAVGTIGKKNKANLHNNRKLNASIFGELNIMKFLRLYYSVFQNYPEEISISDFLKKSSHNHSGIKKRTFKLKLK